MKEYKKALFYIRNKYIILRRQIEEKQERILKDSEKIQKDYLDSITHGLITKENDLLASIGRLIAYKIRKNDTEKHLMEIASWKQPEFDKLEKSKKYADRQSNSINNFIIFLNECSESEFVKYLSYKQGGKND